MEIKLNGASAAIALVAVLGFGAYRISTMQSELQTDALEQLKSFLIAEYSKEDVAALGDRLASRTPISDQEAMERTEEILANQRVELKSVNARGLWQAKDGDEIIVKVEIEVDGGPPPDGESIRYYRMSFRTLSGWKVGARTSVWAYRLKLLG